jgi:hypothetical protein
MKQAYPLVEIKMTDRIMNTLTYSQLLNMQFSRESQANILTLWNHLGDRMKRAGNMIVRAARLMGG